MGNEMEELMCVCVCLCVTCSCNLKFKFQPYGHCGTDLGFYPRPPSSHCVNPLHIYVSIYLFICLFIFIDLICCYFHPDIILDLSPIVVSPKKINILILIKEKGRFLTSTKLKGKTSQHVEKIKRNK
ncbi:hypothetical protein, unlikely [Trypanosoma brucei gambiense DAL972]|uniref:Uncharacterized protein n=1 Tax=Trypanosoma brucei gambiense (strain MHOM/CI/86/DAL972) TaxID=679716 RepID=D0A6F2_TRYB9|nr:hypothetical protein, unlikely [Trypanosoma brucei gambiense DAL972]CBH17253.1 hypothetical protein, unlikely [Trypanosoma brucei gambiense DAL972]|eukprot:XP_011779517.1 hypothetical protein, unlikely [Trypanosoma brucei gambiense DAL972]